MKRNILMLYLLSKSSLKYFLGNANRIYTEMILVIILFVSVNHVHNIVFFVFSFNMLKLPEYGSKEELSHKLKTAITCGAEWFEFT